MTNTTHRPESTATALYVALELSTKEWWLTMSVAPDAKRHRVRVTVGDREALGRALVAGAARFGLPGEALVRSCYEAGREGFWPHRLLTALGVTNLVVDSSSIEVSRRVRRAKTDRLDGAKLLRLLMRHWGGEQEMWHVVQVPSRAAEDARHASRARTTLQIERTRYRNRIHALLALHGTRVRIDRRLPERLATATDWAGEALPPGVHARVLQLWRLLYAVETERYQAQYAEERQIRATTPTPTCAQRLVRLRGVAARSATVLADELLGRDLRNRRQVGALTGLVSAPYDSGTHSHDQGLTRAGLPRVRHIAVQLAWTWLRYQRTSALSQWFQRKFGGRGVVAQRIGIVALARRVVIALWRYVKDGIVPEGALLKA